MDPATPADPPADLSADLDDEALAAAATSAGSGARLLLDLTQILREVPEAHEYDTRLTGQLESILAEALPSFGACQLTHLDGV